MRNRKWLVMGLVISVAVNLVLAGFVAGDHMSRGPVPGMLDPSLSMFRVLRQLPDERREEIRPVVREHFRSMRGDLHRIRQAQRGINEALEQEPFDPKVLNDALADFRAALLDGQQENHLVLVRVATAMTAEERQALQEAMTRHRGFPRGRRSAEHDGR